MTIAEFTILELAGAVATIGGAVAVILKQGQQSRCKTCSICCFKCDRDVPHQAADIENQADNT